jgi:hypothetical protein
MESDCLFLVNCGSLSFSLDCSQTLFLLGFLHFDDLDIKGVGQDSCAARQEVEFCGGSASFGWCEALTLPAFMHAREDESLTTSLSDGFDHLHVTFALSNVSAAE